MTMRSRPGLTLVELLMAGVVCSLVGAAAFGIATTSTRGRVADEDALERQQAMALTLTTFSQDVRAANGLVDPTDTQFALRQPQPNNTSRYVTYRIANGGVQRGVSSVKTTPPASWSDVFDSGLFRVAAGRFTYFLLGNQGGTNAALMRRIEIAGFQLRSQRTNNLVRTAPISAVMREAANARDLVPTCPADLTGHAQGSQPWASGSVFIDVCMRNTTDAPITLGSFTAAWSPGSSSDPMDQLKFDTGMDWGQGQAQLTSSGPVQSFGSPQTVAAGSEARLFVHFHPVVEKIDRLALLFYAASDTAHASPYVVQYAIP